MDKLRRLGQLQRLVQAAGGQVDGRKKLHKLAYLCQRKGTDLGQEFQFHMYGVYSPSLARDVGAATAWELLQEELLPRGAYEIRLPQGSQVDQFNSPSTGEDGFCMARALAGESSPTLEVLSTIVYLWDLGFRGERLETLLRGVKGHLESLFARSFDLASQHFGIQVGDTQ